MIIDQMDATAILRGSAVAARQCTPHRHISWREDVAQEVALAVVRMKNDGKTPGVDAYRTAARYAVKKLLGDSRYAGRRLEHERGVSLDDPERAPQSQGEDPHELRAIAMWRLQRVWPTLTATQRVGIETLLLGGQGCVREVSALRGVEWTCVSEGRRRALERINNPGAFSRVATRAAP